LILGAEYARSLFVLALAKMPGAGRQDSRQRLGNGFEHGGCVRKLLRSPHSDGTLFPLPAYRSIGYRCPGGPLCGKDQGLELRESLHQMNQALGTDALNAN
jgi:hypothetical protein